MEKTNDMVIEVKRLNKIFIASDVETQATISITEQNIPDWMLRKAVKFNIYLKKSFYKDGKPMWRQVEVEDYKKAKETGIVIPTKRANRKKNPFENL